MGKINLDSGGFLRYSNTTESQFDRFVEEDNVRRVLRNLSELRYGEWGKVCYIFGMGAHPRSSYTEIASQPGLQVVYYESVLPAGIRFLKYVIASYRGLIKIEDPAKLPGVFLKLMEKSMVGVYIFDAQLESRFLDAVQHVNVHKSYDFEVKVDPEYLIYLVDADNGESPSGIVEIVSYGSGVHWRTILGDGVSE